VSLSVSDCLPSVPAPSVSYLSTSASVFFPLEPPSAKIVNLRDLDEETIDAQTNPGGQDRIAHFSLTSGDGQRQYLTYLVSLYLENVDMEQGKE